MNIIIAPDSFKGSLSAVEAANAMEEGIRRAAPNATYVTLPLADGGDGTLETLLRGFKNRGDDGSAGPSAFQDATLPEYVTAASDTSQARIRNLQVTGPLGRSVLASYGLLDAGHIAVIEMASASGLQLVDVSNADPLVATSYGTGELIRDAIDQGVDTIILGLGGSATNDGGAGMAQALGIGLRDADGRELPRGGAALAGLSAIDVSGMDRRLSDVHIQLACDVDNPLTGPSGASFMFGPQKGATAEMAETLDDALHHYAAVVREQLHKEIESVPGAGAAGGLGAGCLAFTNASIHSGIELMIDMLHLKDRVVDADYCFVGEGRMDAQTAHGKAPVGVAKAVKSVAPQCKVIAFAGAIGGGIENLYEQGIDAIICVSPGAVSLDQAMHCAYENLSRSCENVTRILA